MKLLLTSQMIHNESIANALRGLVGKPISEASITYIITSHNGASGEKSWFAENMQSLYGLGWKNFYVIDVAGADGLPSDGYMKQIEDSDVITIGGGANYFLGYWLEKSGLMSKFSELLANKVYVGASAGSMLVQKELATSSQAMKEFSVGNWNVDSRELGPIGRRSAACLGLVDFMIRPHYDSSGGGHINDGLLQEVADHFDRTLYALDDETALRVVDDQIDVISDGEWKVFNAEKKVKDR